MAEIYNIASLPYKQQRFGSLRVETEDEPAEPNSKPYSLTAKQKEKSSIPQDNFYQAPVPSSESRTEEDDDDIRRKTFIE